jgi:hypothetical protein
VNERRTFAGHFHGLPFGSGGDRYEDPGMSGNQAERARSQGTALVDELVAEAPNGEDVPRPARVAFDLLPQSLDVGVEGLRVAHVLGSPHIVDQELPGEEAALPLEEELEEAELLRREPHELPPDRDLVASGATMPARRRCARTRETSSRIEKGLVT